MTFLAPRLFWFYKLISRYLADKLGHPTEMVVGSDYALLDTHADLAFVCGLAYVEHTRRAARPFEPLVAPVLTGQRYGGKPIYFSDLIVARASPFQLFADLRGRSWAYNEPFSQSGYGIVRFHLAQAGRTDGFFSRIVEAGYHERSIQLVCAGAVDAAAIDSHVLTLLMRDDPARVAGLRIIDTFGPSPIQPLAAGAHVSTSLKSQVKNVLLEMSKDRAMKPALARALVDRFEPVSDATYNAIREMRALADAAQMGPRTVI
jgi:phosphonate transport system substrate-binding protein